MICLRCTHNMTSTDSLKIIDPKKSKASTRCAQCEGEWILIADGLNTHKSEEGVRLVARYCNQDDDLGTKQVWHSGAHVESSRIPKRHNPPHPICLYAQAFFLVESLDCALSIKCTYLGKITLLLLELLRNQALASRNFSLGQDPGGNFFIGCCIEVSYYTIVTRLLND